MSNPATQTSIPYACQHEHMGPQAQPDHPAAVAPGRIVDAWCPECMEVRRHTVVAAGMCQCQVCGHQEPMVAPSESPRRLAPG